MASIDRDCGFGRQLCSSQRSQFSLHHSENYQPPGVLIWLVLFGTHKSRHACRPILFVPFGPYVAPVLSIAAFLLVPSGTYIFVEAQVGGPSTLETAVLSSNALFSFDRIPAAIHLCPFVSFLIGCLSAYAWTYSLLFESGLALFCMWPAHWRNTIQYPIWSMIPRLLGLVQYEFGFSIIYIGLSFDLKLIVPFVIFLFYSRLIFLVL